MRRRRRRFALYCKNISLPAASRLPRPMPISGSVRAPWSCRRERLYRPARARPAPCLAPPGRCCRRARFLRRGDRAVSAWHRARDQPARADRRRRAVVRGTLRLAAVARSPVRRRLRGRHARPAAAGAVAARARGAGQMRGSLDCDRPAAGRAGALPGHCLRPRSPESPGARGHAFCRYADALADRRAGRRAHPGGAAQRRTVGPAGFAALRADPDLRRRCRRNPGARSDGGREFHHASGHSGRPGPGRPGDHTVGHGGCLAASRRVDKCAPGTETRADMADLHFLANPARFRRFSRRVMPSLAFATALALPGGLSFALVPSPPDYQQGETVRIMFVHVPSAWLSMMGYALLAALGASLLVWRHPLAALMARAAAPVGASFALVCLVTGSLWGRPMWGTYWVWDARLTSMLLLFFLYLGHMALSRAYDDPERGDRAAAILALIGVINLPIIKFSVDWWNTLHQPASIARLDAPAIPPPLLLPLLSIAAPFLLLFILLVLLPTETDIDRLRLGIADQTA